MATHHVLPTRARWNMAVLILVSMALLGATACDGDEPADTTAAATTGSDEQTSSTDERDIISTFDRSFDAAHRITLEIPDGYGNHGFAYLKSGLVETGVSVWVVDRVYADGCRADGSRIERSPDGTVEGLVALLADQRGFRVTTPTDVTVDGFSGTYMERTLPRKTDPIDCFASRFQVWRSRGNGNRYLGHRGQQDLLWILDVDGAPLVIDAPLGSDASEQDRAEVLEIVDSIQIDPR